MKQASSKFVRSILSPEALVDVMIVVAIVVIVVALVAVGFGLFLVAQVAST